MKKNRIRLTESQLHRVIKESVNEVLRGSTFVNGDQVIDGDKAYLGHIADVFSSEIGCLDDLLEGIIFKCLDRRRFWRDDDNSLSAPIQSSPVKQILLQHITSLINNPY